MEYCEQTATDRNGPAGEVIDALDSLLYQSGPVTGDEYHLEGNRDTQAVQCSFSYLHPDLDSWARPLVETKLSIQFEANRLFKMETYTVALAWRVDQEDASPDFFTSRYSIGINGDSSVWSLIEAPDVINETVETRPMTTYDFRTLLKELAIVGSLHSTEVKNAAAGAEG